ncbi:hypothetical protein [Microbacterium paludicola]|uniref:hypothetical protein n=1 Tax=Microbacterium paludicola TaxID=300019 RepID=UPI0011A9FE2C|nr:hypothetical protein [Microbacterium paludicola]
MSDADELRMLRAKAYGPGGGLSAQELERLHALEGRLRLPSVAQPVSSAAAPQPPLNDLQQEELPDRGPSQEEARGEASVADELVSRSVERAEGESKRDGRAERVETEAPSPNGRRWPLLAASALAILVIGLGIGWGIWGWDGRASALAVAHSDTLAEIEAQMLYDPGTVVPLAEQHGVVIWRADRSDGEELCVIATAPERSGHGCMTYEEFDDTGWVNATIMVPDGDERAGESMLTALLRMPDGEVTAYTQVWVQTMESEWESRYSEDELAQLREIEAAGYDPQSLELLGRDGSRAVWSQWTAGGFCLIALADDGVVEACGEEPDSGLSMQIIVDGLPTRYVVQSSSMRGPQLTVFKDVDTEYSVGADDDPMFDDFFVDDTTGEFSG